MRKINKILILGHSNLGDLCYDLIIVRPLRRQFPGAEITVLTSSRARDVLGGCEGVDKVILFDKKDRGLRAQVKLILRLRKEKFDLIVVLKSSLMHVFLGGAAVWSAADYLKGRKVFQDPRHVADIYLDMLRSKGVQAGHEPFYLGRKDVSFSSRDFLESKGILPADKIAGIIPAAAWSLKNWPVSHWNELAGELMEKHGCRVISFSKSGSDPFASFVIKNLSPKITVVDSLTLRQVMDLLLCCRVVIGPDSGLLHIAGCSGVPVIGLYGATPGDHIYPYYHRDNILRPRTALDCVPCYPGGGPCRRITQYQVGQCMEDISVQDVLARAILYSK